MVEELKKIGHIPALVLTAKPANQPEQQLKPAASLLSLRSN